MDSAPKSAPNIILMLINTYDGNRPTNKNLTEKSVN